jgi:hypothetical protein
MKRKIPLIMILMALVSLSLLVGMGWQSVQANISPAKSSKLEKESHVTRDATSGITNNEVTHLLLIQKQEPSNPSMLVPLRPSSGRLLSFATTSWDAVMAGEDLTYSTDAYLFDLLTTRHLLPDPSPDLYFLSRLYLEFELPQETQDDIRWLNLVLPVCETPNSPEEKPVGFTIHKGTWSSSLSQENSAAIWSSWSSDVLTAQSDVALGDMLILPLPLEILPTGEGKIVRLVLRVVGEGIQPVTVWRTCFVQEHVALELVSAPEN